MTSAHSLEAQASSHLQGIIASVLGVGTLSVDPQTSFRELNVDSFMVLKIIKRLEEDFGHLPKTLLFEYFTLQDLSRYFAREHSETLKKRAGVFVEPKDSARASEPLPSGNAAAGGAVALLERDAAADAVMSPLLASLFTRFKTEGSVSRGTRCIAPYVFLGSARRGYFNFARRKSIVLAYAYTGPDNYFLELAEELRVYCAARSLGLNLFSGAPLAAVGGVPFFSNPFGAMQRIRNIREFSLDGGAMRRLRHLVGKFEKAGACRVVEHRCGVDAAADAAVVEVIDEWCAKKGRVNPLVTEVRAEIAGGALAGEHRLFVTYVDEVIQNAILITPLSQEQNGYLMDLEFYRREMPLGGLEYAIVRIIQQLATEGRDLLSLGGTYGCRLESSPTSDPAVDRLLDELQSQNIFNDQGNLQFKNKFRPENSSIYLCRESSRGQVDEILDIIMMIADPDMEPGSSKIGVEGPASGTGVAVPSAVVGMTGAEEVVADGGESLRTETVLTSGADVADRRQALERAQWNPLRIASESVGIDLKTDSWARTHLAAIDGRMSELYALLQSSGSPEDALRGVFPFRHFVLTDSGRTAEQVLYRSWPKKGLVLQNLLFPTGIVHQIDNGFTPVELPAAEIFKTSEALPLKGTLLLSEVAAALASKSADIALGCVEVGNNAAGGAPVPLQHLEELRALLASRGIPLVMDITRVVDNAERLIAGGDSRCAGQTLWEVVRKIASFADVIVGSLAKNFGLNTGGIVATNDAGLLERFRAAASGVPVADLIECRLIGLALQNRKYIDRQIERRAAAVGGMTAALAAAGVPVLPRAGNHCVLLDARRVAGFEALECPAASLLAWIYLHTGVRGGELNVGMQKGTAINEIVRLAIPLGLPEELLADASTRLQQLFKTPPARLDLSLESRDEHWVASYRRKEASGAGVHAAAAQGTAGVAQAAGAQAAGVVAQATKVVTAAAAIPAEETAVAAQATAVADTGIHAGCADRSGAPGERPAATRRRPLALAVVGMGGRYPQARNLRELWENLRGGRDCVGEMPASRRALRRAPGKTYRGGFLEDVDRFDSLFFNISPREAEMLDPQERLFLEVAWEAIEDAGYFPESLPRDVGVYVGAVWTTYQVLRDECVDGRSDSRVPNSFLWSIANRVSYWMNLSGPSITVDTACSSSLTALQLACEAIAAGRCSAAIVGGVNLDLDDIKFDINEGGGALSKDGLCRSFGTGANGYVAGEGVGAILIKPLAQALADGDCIHGVIRSVVVNHGGRTSGYTVPNPQAQASLVRAALEEAGLEGRSIGYIEAHGTGTQLGDPIEIRALCDAFGNGVQRGGCAIGSIKSNIGHLEAAAGVVSVCKVLLQMRHRTLVPSLHSATPNELIDFESSPFYVVQSAQEWRPREKLAGTPLRAGVSSFGAGGANAHVILESYDEEQHPRPVREACLEVVPLSARNEEQLRAVARRLRDFLADDASGRAPRATLADIAYTLRLGRKSFDHRLVVLAQDERQLVESLSSFLEGKSDERVRFGHVKNGQSVTKILQGIDREAWLELLSRQHEPARLAELWVDGILADWRSFAPTRGVRRVSLPTYPFADRRHWAFDPRKSGAMLAGRSEVLHALIDANQSTFGRQLFRKTFYPAEFVVRDHRVGGVPTVPGVAFLEMVRKAGELAAGESVHKIQNIIWVSPIALPQGQPKTVFIELRLGSDQSAQFEVWSEGTAGERLLHSQGRLRYAASPPPPQFIDLAALRARTDELGVGQQVYSRFKTLGLDLGPSFQVLEEVRGHGAEALGSLRLSAEQRTGPAQMPLYPPLLDGAFQAGVAARLAQGSPEMVVPFTIGEVEILGPLVAECFSHVTEAREEGRAASGTVRTNVSIVDGNGRVLVRIRESVGVPLREVHAKAVQAPTADPLARLTLYEYPWIAASLPPREESLPGVGGTLLLFDDGSALSECSGEVNLHPSGFTSVVTVRPGEGFARLGASTYTVNPGQAGDFLELLRALESEGRPARAVAFAWPLSQWLEEEQLCDPEARERAVTLGPCAFLLLCQALIKLHLESSVRVVYLYLGGEDGCQPHNEAIGALVKSARLEHPRFVVRAVEIARDQVGAQRIVESMTAELLPNGQDASVIRYSGGTRYVRTQRARGPLEPDPEAAVDFERLKQGACLVTGGGRGLGLLVAEHLAKAGVNLVLTGRSPATALLEAACERLRALGIQAAYIPADVANVDAVRSLIAEVKQRFGRLTGVVHAAGVIKDSLLREKTRVEVDAVLAPKVAGTINLDEATRDEPLEFFVGFSSLAAIGGNAGQCDYAYGNHFMDRMLGRRETLRGQGRRKGKSLSINWSLWADGGMKLDAATEELFRNVLGLRPLSREVGLSAFDAALRCARGQVAVVDADRGKLERAWGLRSDRVASAAKPQDTAANSAAALPDATAAGHRKPVADRVARVTADLTRIACEHLKLDAVDVAADKVLLDLGFDSIGLTTYANAINALYGLDITPVLFFDRPSIDAVAQYLANEHAAAIDQHAGAQGEQEPPGPGSLPRLSPAELPADGERGGMSTRAAPVPADMRRRFIDQPIAIVGMSGVMPQSRDLSEFWENLRDGKDMISVVPRDRWHWEDYFGDPLKEPNKSNSKWGGFMREVDKFDPLFFGISPREAQMMDPQQRLFLETVWQAVEDSGHRVSDLAGTRTGVFVGVATNDYIDLIGARGIPLDGYSASGNSHSVLANRISFLLNLRGPSAPLDTACSSSLVAIHRAIESIHTGSCDMAIAGGVQVMLTPAAYISFGMAGMLSGDGKCKTFDRKANGYVRGEGVGAIVLKPLSMAEADGDHIYAVIKATAENHGGKVTTLTAPNATAQSELLIEAYEKAEVDPGTVGYLECHGTGTSLGDPIETQALTTSFAELYRRFGRAPPARPHCGLSAVKSNVGHLETAAGIAGVIKALLAIRHRMIPATLHFEELNPYIHLAGTPFYIVTATCEWQRTFDGSGRPQPLRAGVSSFGFGGANAHVILEEYLPATDVAADARPATQLLVLSAKNDERLREYARRMREHLRTHEVSLQDFAYTLQVGRDAMSDRLAFTANTVEEAQRKLTDYLAEPSAFSAGFCGKARRKPGAAAEEVDTGALIRHEAWEELARAWVAGERVDWTLLHDGRRCHRLALPTYPFARERHWLSDTTAAIVPKPAAAMRHPMLGVDPSTPTSALARFVCRFKGDEFYLADHSVRGQRILPGVGYLEMARAAGEAFGRVGVGSIRDVVWLTPIVVGEGGKEVTLKLEPRDRLLHFSVSTSREGDSDLVHCHGALQLGEAAPKIESVDIAAIRGRCQRATLAGPELYQFLATSELEFGPGMRVVRAVHVGQEECLVDLELPAHLAHEAPSFGLHPAMMDGTLHAALGLVKQSRPDIPWSLPYSMEEAELLGDVRQLRYGHARWSEASIRNDQSPVRMSFELLAADGRVLARLRNFIAKPFREAAARSVPIEGIDTVPGCLHLLAPVWNVCQPAVARDLPDGARILLLGDDPSAREWARAATFRVDSVSSADCASVATIAARLRAQEYDELLWIAPEVRTERSPIAETLGDRQECGAITLFRLVKALLEAGFAGRAVRLTVVTRHACEVFPGDEVDPSHSAVIGLVGSLAKEYAHWKVRCVDVERLEAIPVQDLLSLALHDQDKLYARRGAEWLERGLAAVTELPEAPPTYRQRGVYVVIGGAGGLGEVWSRFMIERFQARIVWVGRRPLTAEISGKLAALASAGEAPGYIRADAANRAELARAREEILGRYPAIHGVVHAAVVLRDRSLAQMSEEDFRAVLSAKLDTCVNMAQVFEPDDLDFLLFFSSMMAFTRAAGQSNYAAGSTFEDSFAQYVRRQRRHLVKTVNWGYWGHVGVVADPGYRRAMQKLGVGSIEPDEGMRALQQLMGGALDQLAVVKTLGVDAAGRLAAAETVRCPAGARGPSANEPSFATAALGEPLVIPEGEGLSPQVEALVAEILAAQLASCGDLGGGGTPMLPVAERHRTWLGVSLDYLRSRGLSDAPEGRPREIRSLATLWADWRTVRAEWVQERTHRQALANLLEGCLAALPEVLRGERPATDVMFPNSSTALVEGIYGENPVADFFNSVVARTLERWLELALERNPDRRFRVLEIGAGTGGTTVCLLRELRRFAPALAEYCYSDVSQAFLKLGKARFGSDTGSLTTAIFDVTRPLGSQGIEAGRYDVVIAANVLHATPDIRRTVRNAKAALAPGGVLLLNEISNWSLFNHLTFGLLDGWWLTEDAGLRLSGCPGLSPQSWQQVLRSEGFYGIAFPAEYAHGFGQQIVAAVSDGVVRQPLEGGAQHMKLAIADAVVDASRTTPPQRRPTAVRREGKSRVATASMSEHVRRVLVREVCEALRLEPGRIESETPFAELGVDSIIGVSLVRKIGQALAIDLETTSLFDHSTLEELTAYIVGKWGAQLQGAEPLPADADAADVAVETVGATGGPEESQARPTAVPQRDPVPGIGGREGIQGRPQPIAIIGASGRFGESHDIDEFWRHIRNGDDLVREVSRWPVAECALAADRDRKFCGRGSFVESFDRFDAAFFRIPVEEALYMDPQQRLFLEESWKALEDAGYAGKAVKETQCGVYVGCGGSNYERLFGGGPPPQAFWGNAQSVIPARIAYHLNLRGPAIAVDTACSSSLVTVHLACQALWSGEIDMALAGGVFLQATPGFFQVANRARMLSTTGACRSFDAAADGFVPAEGVGAVVLKRLEDALRDGDHIHAVVVGSGVNQDGSSNGLISPNGRAQERLEQAVYERFHIDPDSIQMLEAHGTGTQLGDSIELDAIGRVFRERSQRKQYCAVGCVKANIGHAAAAAGIASILKVVMCLRHREIPPVVNFEQPNPGIDLTTGPFYVNTQARPWLVAESRPRRAAISSFAFSGTNAHLVIEEAPAVHREVRARPAHLVVLSARTEAQLAQQVRNLHAFCTATTAVHMEDLSYSLAIGRMPLRHRVACAVRNREDLLALLTEWVEGGSCGRLHFGQAQEGPAGQRAGLRRYGQFCIEQCEAASDQEEYVEYLDAIAELFAQGCALELSRLFGTGCRRTPLPTYPFSGDRFWVQAEVAREASALPRPRDVERQAATQAPSRVDERLPASQTPALTRLLSNIRMSPREKVAGFLKESIGKQLKVSADEISAETNFVDLGLGSLDITQLIQQINQWLDAGLSPRVAFEYMSVDALATHLADSYAAQIVAGGRGMESPPVQPAANEAGILEEAELLASVTWRDSMVASEYERVTF